MDGKVLLAGHLDETDGFAEYFQADSALADVTGKGLFALERAGQFPFVTHAPTTKALAGHLEAEWSDAVLTEDVIKRLEELMAEPAEDREIVMRETVRIARYRSMGR